MIVAKGLGRKLTGATGAIVASGLCLVASGGGLGGSLTNPFPSTTETRRPALPVRRVFADRDLTELIPIIVEIINGRR
jgi:hypothetical protein